MSTSVASVTSHFPSPQNGFVTSLASSISSGAATVPLNSVGSYANNAIAVFVVDPGTVSQQTVTGIINTGTVSLTSAVWTAGTNVAHAGGAVVVDYATATHIAMMSKGLLVGHTQAGAHKFTTVLDVSGNESLKLGTSGPSSVNELTITNATTGNTPAISASGDDTNIDINLVPKGTGAVRINNIPFSGAWLTSWTPTYSGFTLGNGVVTAGYLNIGKTILFRLKVVLGTTSSITGALSFSLPVNMGAAYTSDTDTILSTVGILDTGTTYFSGMLRWASASTVQVFAQNSGAASLQISTISSTVPMTWTTGDAFVVSGSYESA